MRQARDEILRRVGAWLVEEGFSKHGNGHFSRVANNTTCHVGFQKLSSGRSVRVICHIDKDGRIMNGPISDPYERAGSPNNKKYKFGWSTRESDIATCSEEYCRYITDVVLGWHTEQIELG